MLLFEHKKDLQGYKGQSPNSKGTYLTQFTFQELQRTARLDYNTIFPDLMKSQCYSLKKLCPWNMQKRGRGLAELH